MLMQSYDFLVLNQKYNCQLQLGGDDQWSNILSGADLIRRKENKPAYAMTFTLLTTSDGKKMGKTAKGAVWLDENKTSPYEFYQYWRNVDDADVEKCLKLLTFIDLETITELTKNKDERINKAKEVLAYELTKLVHGEVAAVEAENQVKAAFSGDTKNMPSIEIDKNTTALIEIMCSCDICKSRGEARRLIEGGGVSVNEEKATSIDFKLNDEIIQKGEFVIHKGKKVHIKVVLK